jgi:zinc protease
VVVQWHVPAASDLKAAAASHVLDGYLFGQTSDLYQQLVLEKQTVDSLFGTYGDNRDPTLFGALARVKDPANAAEVEDAIVKAVAAVASGKINAKRMDAARSNLKYGNILRLETPRDLAVTLARTTAITGDIQWLNKMFAAADDLRPRDLAAYAKKWLVDRNRTTVTLTPASAGKVGGGK